MAWYNKTRKDSDLKTKSWKVRLPKHILFYRDGISESQYGMVLHEERDKILAGCQKAFNEIKKDKNSMYTKGQTWDPKLTLLVVTKRHHARFYPFREVEEREEKVDVSLPCGQVVDTKVVDPIKRDFYLQSHHSALGTARSGHYVVIHDDNNYSLLELQQIVSLVEL